MTRVQILLSEDQDRRLEALARRQQQSKASLVRKAVDLLFRTETDESEPLLGLIEQAGTTGLRYGSRDHDRILAGSRKRS